MSVRGNRYSVPYQLIGRQMEVRESKKRIDVFDGPNIVASHCRLIDPTDARVTVTDHRPPRGKGHSKKGPPPQLSELLLVEPALETYVEGIRRRAYGRGVRVLQRLLRMVREYPRKPLLKAIDEAESFGLYDLDRLERMILRRIGSDYFSLPNLDELGPLTNEDSSNDHDG